MYVFFTDLWLSHNLWFNYVEKIFSPSQNACYSELLLIQLSCLFRNKKSFLIVTIIEKETIKVFFVIEHCLKNSRKWFGRRGLITNLSVNGSRENLKPENVLFEKSQIKVKFTSERCHVTVLWRLRIFNNRKRDIINKSRKSSVYILVVCIFTRKKVINLTSITCKRNIKT